VILLKRFMASVIDSNNRSPEFSALSRKLLGGYVGAMVLVLMLSATAVYHFFAHSLTQATDQQLAIIADAARHNLPAIRDDRTVVDQKLHIAIDDDGDLDLPWQDLQTTRQSVEWFDQTGRLIGHAGADLPAVPLRLMTTAQVVEQGDYRRLTQPIGSPKTPAIQGYVRVSMGTQASAKMLQQLTWGMILGGGVAVVMMAGTGAWLTRRSLLPIAANMARLNQFTADASHELRSPVTAIQTAVEVMQNHPERVHPRDQRKLEIIVSATQQMSALIDNLLFLARTTDESHLIDRHEVLALHQILGDTVELIQFRATAARIRLDVPPIAPTWVQGNAIHLRRVFWNLLDNALKYTPPDGVVSLALIVQPQSVVVVVQDTGRGIALEHQARIFERFWRAAPSRSRKAGGTGLGLSIVQAIVVAHQGQIRVSSQLGVGSRFEVELPVRIVDRPNSS
jgi:signal transduction histidine kinase